MDERTFQQEVRREIKRQKRKKRAGCLIFIIIVIIVVSVFSKIKKPDSRRHYSRPSYSRSDTSDPSVKVTMPSVTEAAVIKKNNTEDQNENENENENEDEHIEDENADVTETPEEPDVSEDELSVFDIKNAIENGDFSLVDPEFKAVMDEYESFYDDYIAFLNSYNSENADVFGMLNDYINMMDKMTDWAERIDSIDTDSLSPADNAYYFLVTLRIEKKMIGSLF